MSVLHRGKYADEERSLREMILYIQRFEANKTKRKKERNNHIVHDF